VAKPRPVPGIRPDRRLRPNARRILRVRIEEVWSYEEAVGDPANVTELHDMRIAMKRLRYLLEIFDVAFDDDLAPFVDEVRDLQDVLGDVHDADVQLPMLEEHLRTLEVHGGTPGGGADERPGVRTLIARARVRRDEGYRRFRAHWARLAAEGFRRRLEDALGVAPAP